LRPPSPERRSSRRANASARRLSLTDETLSPTFRSCPSQPSCSGLQQRATTCSLSDEGAWSTAGIRRLRRSPLLSRRQFGNREFPGALAQHPMRIEQLRVDVQEPPSAVSKENLAVDWGGRAGECFSGDRTV